MSQPGKGQGAGSGATLACVVHATGVLGVVGRSLPREATVLQGHMEVISLVLPCLHLIGVIEVFKGLNG